MKFSLITTLYNESDNILKFLDSYKNQTRYADEFIIVDGGSSDGTIKLITNYANENSNLNIKLIVDKTCSKKYISGPVAKGRNVAIQNTKYDYIVVTDAGCILDQYWYEEIIKPFEDNCVDVVSGWYEANITNEFQQQFSDIMMPKLETIDRKKFLPSSRSLAFKKSCWKKVGGYPTLTLTAEDTKFDLDLKKIGCKFQFTSKAVVYWDVPFDMKEARAKLFNYGYGDGQLRQRLIPKLLKMLFLIFPIHLLINKDKRKHIWLSYNILLFNSLGFLKGLLHPVKENIGK
jgi:glycosyltransferase involved in cell wall biosynthesis